VDVQRAGTLDDDIHPDLQSIEIENVARREPRLQSSLKGGLTGTSPGFRARLPRQTLSGFTDTKMQGGAMANDPCSIADFIRPGWPQAMKTLRV
jgi:hypothetical protein